MWNLMVITCLFGYVVDAHRGIVDNCETHIQPYHITQEDLSEMALGNASVGKCWHTILAFLKQQVLCGYMSRAVSWLHITI